MAKLDDRTMMWIAIVTVILALGGFAISVYAMGVNSNEKITNSNREIVKEFGLLLDKSIKGLKNDISDKIDDIKQDVKDVECEVKENSKSVAVLKDRIKRK